MELSGYSGQSWRGSSSEQRGHGTQTTQQDWGEPRTGERLPLVSGGGNLLRHSPGPCSPLLVSSGAVLNVVFHFMPEVLLDPQMMSRRLDSQWIIKIPQISKQSLIPKQQPSMSSWGPSRCYRSNVLSVTWDMSSPVSVMGVPGPGQAFPLWEAPCCMHQKLQFQTEFFHPGSNPHLGVTVGWKQWSLFGSGTCTLHVQGKLASSSTTSFTSSLSLTDTCRAQSEAVADAWDTLRPSSRFSLLASISITASFFLGTQRQARWAWRPTPCPAGGQRREAAPHTCTGSRWQDRESRINY